MVVRECLCIVFQDIQPVEMCITAIASSPHMSTEWHALVRVGIIERLCECVNGTRQTLNISATQTRHSRVRLVNAHHSRLTTV